MIIDNQMAKDLVREEVKKQIKCEHKFEVKHIELLDEDVEICSECDINKKLYLLSLSTPCFTKHKWYNKTCWVCPLELLCQAQKWFNAYQETKEIKK